MGAGNFSSFLFQLLPKVALHSPSGVNQNFQYCGHSFASLPNGIGFGGQVCVLLHPVCLLHASAGLVPASIHESAKLLMQKLTAFLGRNVFKLITVYSAVGKVLSCVKSQQQQCLYQQPANWLFSV